MGSFEYSQAQEVRDTFARYAIRYLFIGKSGAVILGYPDTTQDIDLFIQRSLENFSAFVKALKELGFELTDGQSDEIISGKVLLKGEKERKCVDRNNCEYEKISCS